MINTASRRGEEFRDDTRAPGSGNAAARRVLSAADLAPLTTLQDGRSMGAVATTLGLIAAAVGFGVAVGPSPWLVPAVLLIGIQQHALFILAHEAAHYRLHSNRAINDALGRFIGMAGGVSMCTYRVTHRLHHNNLYGPEDPDTAIHGGYPRGVAYLWKKLLQDLAGLNAWKTYAYFFGAPALNELTHKAARPLDDTSPALRAAARRDRWGVVAFHLSLPLALTLLWGGAGLLLYALLWMLPLVTVFNQEGTAPWHLWVPALAQTTLMGRVLKGEDLAGVDVATATLVCVLLTLVALAYVTRTLRSVALK